MKIKKIPNEILFYDKDNEQVAKLFIKHNTLFFEGFVGNAAGSFFKSAIKPLCEEYIKSKLNNEDKMTKISNKVMILNEHDDAIFYRTACDCTDKDCDTSLWLEYDKEFGDITLSFYKDLKYCSWWGYGKGIFWKILEKFSKKINKPLEDKEGMFWEFLESHTYNFHEKIWGCWKRIKGCFRLLFTGKIELEEHVMIMGEEHISEIIRALTEGRVKLRGYKNANTIN